MNKITVLKSHIPSKEFWELCDYASDKEVTHSRATEYAINQCVVNHSVEITDEEIEKACPDGENSADNFEYGKWRGFMECWEYIKQRINPH